MIQKSFEIPILFLIFNRKDTALEVFNQIKQIRPTKLYISADGPRHDKEGEDTLCQETRNLITQIDWECELHTRFLDENLGCAYAISSAITWFFETEEMGIILEDDCVPHLDFFLFCKLMLEKYKNEDRVMLITGDNNISNIQKPLETYYFSRQAYIWGWATWKRAWDKFDISIKDWKYNARSVLRDPYYDGVPEYRERFMYEYDDVYLHDHQRHTWAQPWGCSVVMNNGLCIIPRENLISNIGLIGLHFDGEFTYGFNNPVTDLLHTNVIHPKKIEPNQSLDYIRFKNDISAMSAGTCPNSIIMLGLRVAVFLRKLYLFPLLHVIHPINIGLYLTHRKRKF